MLILFSYYLIFFTMPHNLYICMTKSHKANPFWVDMYDNRHTLFKPNI